MQTKFKKYTFFVDIDCVSLLGHSNILSTSFTNLTSSDIYHLTDIDEQQVTLSYEIIIAIKYLL